MIYLFKTYDLAEFRDFNLFTAIKSIETDAGNWNEFSDMEGLESFIIDDYNEVGEYCESIDANNCLVIVDVDNQTISKRIYTLKLEFKVIDSDEKIQKLIDKATKAEEKRVKELEELQKEVNAP